MNGAVGVIDEINTVKSCANRLLNALQSNLSARSATVALQGIQLRTRLGSLPFPRSPSPLRRRAASVPIVVYTTPEISVTDLRRLHVMKFTEGMVLYKLGIDAKRSLLYNDNALK